MTSDDSLLLLLRRLDEIERKLDRMEEDRPEHLARIIHGGVGFWEVSGD